MRKITALSVCLLLLFLLPQKSRPCSTFLLESDYGIFVGHNLDESIGFDVAGMVSINKRNVYKEGFSNDDFYAPVNGEKISPSINWVSKYGSLTFNNRGRDFPDGGVNERGLSIFEMSLKGSLFKEDKSLPTLIIELWIQYQLDNFETVEQVIKNTSEIMIDGRTWHFFISDRSGDAVVIEFIKGEVVVHKGETLPVKALCNSIYSYELKRLKGYEGFGGDKPAALSDKKIPRFVHAARMLKDYKNSLSKSPVDYAFDILNRLHEGRSDRWDNKWSIVVDMKNLTVYFTTYRNRKVRYTSLNSFDLSCDKPVKLLDVHAGLSGDVTKNFVDYSYQLNFKFAKQYQENIASFFKNFLPNLKKMGLTPQIVAERFAGYSENTRCRTQPDEARKSE